MNTADDSADERELDRAIRAAMRTLRSLSPPLQSEALEIVERIDAEIAQRRRKRIAAGLARWLDANPLPRDN